MHQNPVCPASEIVPPGPLPQLAIGAPAPDFTLPTEGRSLSLAALRGQPVILAFAPPDWDPSLHTQMALYNAVVERLAPSGTRLLGITTQDIWCSLEFSGSSPLRFPLLHDFDPEGSVAQLYGVQGERAIFVIDAEGLIRWRYVLPTGLLPRPDDIMASVETIAGLGDAARAEAAHPRTGQALSRRQFLVTTLAATLALTVWPALGHAETPAAGTAPARHPNVLPHTRPVRLRVNGAEHQLELDTRVSLLDALRDHIGLTGTKKGCDQGSCGACTVISSGRRIKSCLTLAVMQEGQPVTTIEGLSHGEALHPMQAAFIKHDAFQCGFCTPGQIMSAVALVEEGHTGSAPEIREWMSGNICRCGAYPHIVAAIEEVAKGEKS